MKQQATMWLSIIIIGVLGIFLIRLYFDFTDVKNENKKIENQVEVLNRTNNKLTAERDSLKDEIKLLVEDNKSLSIEVEDLKEEIARLNLAIETLQKEINKMTENVPVNNYAVINLSDSERDLLAKILALEAGDQPDVGQRAVVEVVFNRVLTGWASTVEGVIYDKGQFATVKYLNHPYQTPDEKEYANIDWVLEHGSTILPPDYVFFATYKANGKDFIHIEDHYFGRR